MKQKDFAPCDNRITSPPVFRANPNHLPCASCGSTERQLGAGKGPHTASMWCGKCDGFIKWVGKIELVKLNQGGLR